MFVTGPGVTAAAQGQVTAPGQGLGQGQGQGEGHDQDPEVGQEEGHTPLPAVTFRLSMMSLVTKMT